MSARRRKPKVPGVAVQDSYTEKVELPGSAAWQLLLHEYNTKDVELTMAMHKGGNEMQLDADFYRAEAHRLLEAAAKVDGIPQNDDTFGDGSVIVFHKMYASSDTKYHFAAVKSGNYRYVTGSRQSGQTFNWTQLMQFIGLNNIDSVQVVTDVKTLRGYVTGVQKALESEEGK